MSWAVSTDGEEILRELKSDQYFAVKNNMLDKEYFTERKNVSESEISLIVHQLLLTNRSGTFDANDTGSWLEISNKFLNNWQKSELENVRDSESGIRCLLNSWLVTQNDLREGTYCNATWDNVYCWPPTPTGSTVNRTCIDAFTETQPFYAPHLEGHGYRVCLANGSWLWGNWTNYTECADSYDAFVDAVEKQVEEKKIVTMVQYILFIGSILSLICISTSIMIFYYFRVLWCDRITMHIHLMAALMLRYIMLFIITEPFILKHTTNYRDFDMLCKGVLIIYLYATLTSINWMFIQGIYINGKLTTNVFHGRTPFKVYYTIGWFLPSLLMTIWSTIMYHNHDVHCWSGYAEMNEIWLIICPIILALIVNFLFLINILRVMLTKVHMPGPSSDVLQFRRAAKATIFLFPLLGINNLLFLYNPGGDLHKYFVILNTFFGSTQGIFVSIVYCYMSKDVCAAFLRLYRRFRARRSANSIRRHSTRQSRRHTGSANSSLLVEQAVNSRSFRCRAIPAINTPQLSSIQCLNHRGGIIGHPCHQSSCQIINSPSQLSPCEDIVNTSNRANLPVSPSRNSVMSTASNSSGRIVLNTRNNSVVYHHSYRNTGRSALLPDSPEHPKSKFDCKGLAFPTTQEKCNLSCGNSVTMV